MEKSAEVKNDDATVVAKNRSINILIVEDDDIQLKLIEGLLRQAGYGSVSVQDGHSAIEKMQQETFNLIISDVNMPGGMSGFSLVKTLRGIDKFKAIPFMFVTGRREKRDVIRAIEDGVDDYAVKPIDRDIFLAKIESLVFERGRRFSFIERPVHTSADFHIKLEIDGLSEQAIRFVSPIPLPENYKTKIGAEIFNELGIEPPNLRISRCEPSSEDRNRYRIRASFIGLSDQEMTAIRRWIMKRQTKVLCFILMAEHLSLISNWVN